jgi:hypothetical protein
LGRLDSIMGRMRLRIIFSKIFENSGRRLIGLYDLGESGGFPGLRIMMITENFHRTGKYESLNMELYIYIREHQ